MLLLRDAEPAAAFDRAATRYDTLVAAAPGHPAHLRRSARRLGMPRDAGRPRVLDLGRGTGASTAALAAAMPDADLGERVRRAGSERVRVLPLPGRQTGITHTVVARRPGAAAQEAEQ